MSTRGADAPRHRARVRPAVFEHHRSAWAKAGGSPTIGIRAGAGGSSGDSQCPPASAHVGPLAAPVHERTCRLGQLPGALDTDAGDLVSGHGQPASLPTGVSRGRPRCRVHDRTFFTTAYLRLSHVFHSPEGRGPRSGAARVFHRVVAIVVHRRVAAVVDDDAGSVAGAGQGGTGHVRERHEDGPSLSAGYGLSSMAQIAASTRALLALAALGS